MSCELIGAVKGERAFSTESCLLALREESRDSQKIWDDANKVKLKSLVKYLESLDRHIYHT